MGLVSAERGSSGFAIGTLREARALVIRNHQEENYRSILGGSADTAVIVVVQDVVDPSVADFAYLGADLEVLFVANQVTRALAAEVSLLAYVGEAFGFEVTFLTRDFVSTDRRSYAL